MSRDFSIPFSEAELEELKGSFRTMPSYTDEGHIFTTDVAALCQAMKFERTPEQLTAYKNYYDKNFGGIITLTEFVKSLKALHDIGETTKNCAAVFDKDGNGFISEDEYKEVVKVIQAHDPRLKELSFEQFVMEADTNKDGKVDVEELANWIKDALKST